MAIFKKTPINLDLLPWPEWPCRPPASESFLIDKDYIDSDLAKEVSIERRYRLDVLKTCFAYDQNGREYFDKNILQKVREAEQNRREMLLSAHERLRRLESKTKSI